MKRYQTIILLTIIVFCSYQQNSEPQLRNKLNYDAVFSDQSQTVAIFVSCSAVQQVKISIQSFFFYNTQPVKNVKIIHCATTNIFNQILKALPYDAGKYRDRFQIMLQPQQNKYNLIKTLQYTLLKLQNEVKYVYLSNTLWQTTKGYGFIQNAISILKHAQKTGAKISQIITNYPYWRINSRLEPLQWTQTGEAYHYVEGFDEKSFNYFTLSPSVFDYQIFFRELFDRKLSKQCELGACDSQKQQVFQSCCLWKIGQYVHEKGYKLVYYNDGTSIPNCRYLAA